MGRAREYLHLQVIAHFNFQEDAKGVQKKHPDRAQASNRLTLQAVKLVCDQKYKGSHLHLQRCRTCGICLRTNGDTKEHNLRLSKNGHLAFQ